MTVTPAKLAANRANARKSTGPRTRAGKSRSSRNALAHGLFTRHLVLHHESQAEFDAFRQAFIEDLEPSGVFEQMLVDRIVSAAWKLQRVDAIEARITDVHRYNLKFVEKHNLAGAFKLIDEQGIGAGSMEPEEYEDLSAVDAQTFDFMTQARAIERLGRHAQRLEMSIYRATRELEKSRKRTQTRPRNRLAQTTSTSSVTPEVEVEDNPSLQHRFDEIEAKGPDVSSEHFEGKSNEGSTDEPVAESKDDCNEKSIAALSSTMRDAKDMVAEATTPRGRAGGEVVGCR